MRLSRIVPIIIVLAVAGCADRTPEPPVASGPERSVAVSVSQTGKEKKKAVRRQSAERAPAPVELRPETDRAGRKNAPRGAAAVGPAPVSAPVSAPVPEPVPEVSPEPPPEIGPSRHKKVFEFIDIDGEKYTVPWPWRGKRIEQPAPARSALRQIPQAYTWQKSKLFIRTDACKAFVAMAEQAAAEGIDLRVHSGFRSIGYQKNIFSRLMAEGRTWDDLVRYVAPPGYSEHMLGVAVDLHPSNWQFASTEAYGWLKEHAGDFGFSETYPEHGIEGFPWEAWHWRYNGPAGAVGAAGAKQDVFSGQALTEYRQSKQQQ